LAELFKSNLGEISLTVKEIGLETHLRLISLGMSVDQTIRRLTVSIIQIMKFCMLPRLGDKAGVLWFLYQYQL
jgi:hypothetical protein